MTVLTPQLVEKAAQAAYEQGMAGYAEMTPLPPHLEEICTKLDRWDTVEPWVKEHWRAIAIEVLLAAGVKP